MTVAASAPTLQSRPGLKVGRELTTHGRSIPAYDSLNLTEENGTEDRGTALSRAISFLFSLVYIIIGFVVAASHHYFEHLDALKPIASAALAVLLWPLILFGVNLHLK
jgi:hypothetical protein